MDRLHAAVGEEILIHRDGTHGQADRPINQPVMFLSPKSRPRLRSILIEVIRYQFSLG